MEKNMDAYPSFVMNTLSSFSVPSVMMLVGIKLM